MKLLVLASAIAAHLTIIDASSTGTGRRLRWEGSLKKPPALALASELSDLRLDVDKAWKAWAEVRKEVEPKVEHMSQEADELRGVLDSVKQLRIPSIRKMCSELNSCNSCANVEICGWCAQSMTCVPGTQAGPVESTMCLASTTYSFSTCPNMSCEDYTTCGACTGDELCGWHQGDKKCVTGTEFGPTSDGLPAFPAKGYQHSVNHMVLGTALLDWVHRDQPRSSCEPPPTQPCLRSGGMVGEHCR